MTTTYTIQGIAGAGYRVGMQYNPRNGEWECGHMDLSRYTMTTRQEAESFLQGAISAAGEDVREIEIEIIEEEEYEDEDEDA